MTNLSDVLKINSENEITSAHIYAKPKQVIPFFYWDCLCEKLGRWPTEDEQLDFFNPRGEARAVSTES